MTILVGSNASGKSTIIQALLLARLSVEMLCTDSRLVKRDFVLNINGPYMLQLGKASNVLSNNPTSGSITITIIDMDYLKTMFTYRHDGAYASHLLQGELSFPSSINENIFSLQEDFSYLHAERYGPRKSLEMGPSSKLTVGYQGEYVSSVIFQADSRRIDVNSILKRESRSSRFSHQVEAWMNFILPHMQIDYRPIEDLNVVTLEYKNHLLDTNFFPPPNTGFGISYILPIVVEGLMLSTKNNSTLIVENPEAHLHPLGQSRIGRFLALLSLCGVQVIVETHSEHVVNGARLQMALSERTDDIRVSFFIQREQNVKIVPLIINKYGEISEWPSGFFDQEQKDLKELLFLKREMRKRES